MSTVAIVYHSGYGHTAVLAEYVSKGAKSLEGTRVVLLKADDLLKADTGPCTHLRTGATHPLPQKWDASSVHAWSIRSGRDW